MRDHLLRGRLHEFGYALHQAWDLKRQFSSKISNSHFDATYELARRHGALVGKSWVLAAVGFSFFTPETFP